MASIPTIFRPVDRGAEVERGKWMRGEARCDLDELVRLERKADQAVRALGIVERPPETPKPWEVLQAYLEARQQENAGDGDGEGA